MGTITDKINKSIETKEAIGQAIINKGVDVPANTVFSDYPEKINAITGSGEGGSGGIAMDSFYNVRTNNGTNYSYLFCYCKELTTLDLSNFDTSNVTTMFRTFSECDKLTTLDLSNFDTSKVTTMNSMFYYCRKLTELDLSNFDTSNVKNMGSMFSNCKALTSLNLSNFNMSNVTSMSEMFYNCTSLHTLRLDNCSNDTINKIITNAGLPAFDAFSSGHYIYCKQANVGDLKAPQGWYFRYV